MNGVVVELRKRNCIVLTENGDFIKTARKGQNIGDKVEIPSAAGAGKRLAPIISIAASLLIFLSVGGYTFFCPFGVVSVDVNPSIEFTINRFDLVLRARGVNDDGTAILETIDPDEYLYKPVNTAVTSAIGSLRENEYFKSDSPNYVVVAANTQKENNTQNLINELSETISAEDDITPITIAASDKETEKAHQLGTTAGKLNIIDRLGEVMDESEEFKESDWIDSSVAEIMGEIDTRRNRLSGDSEPADIPAGKIPEEDLNIDISGNDGGDGNDDGPGPYILPVEPTPTPEPENEINKENGNEPGNGNESVTGSGNANGQENDNGQGNANDVEPGKGNAADGKSPGTGGTSGSASDGASGSTSDGTSGGSTPREHTDGTGSDQADMQNGILDNSGSFSDLNRN